MLSTILCALTVTLVAAALLAAVRRRHYGLTVPLALALTGAVVIGGCFSDVAHSPYVTLTRPMPKFSRELDSQQFTVSVLEDLGIVHYQPGQVMSDAERSQLPDASISANGHNGIELRAAWDGPPFHAKLYGGLLVDYWGPREQLKGDVARSETIYPEGKTDMFNQPNPYVRALIGRRGATWDGGFMVVYWVGRWIPVDELDWSCDTCPNP